MMVTQWLQTQTALRMTVGLMMVSCLVMLVMIAMTPKKYSLFLPLSRGFGPELSRGFIILWVAVG
jgi:hypothetical protein